MFCLQRLEATRISAGLKIKVPIKTLHCHILSYPQDRRKGMWLPTSLSPEAGCALILPTPLGQKL